MCHPPGVKTSASFERTKKRSSVLNTYTKQTHTCAMHRHRQHEDMKSVHCGNRSFHTQRSVHTKNPLSAKWLLQGGGVHHRSLIGGSEDESLSGDEPESPDSFSCQEQSKSRSEGRGLSARTVLGSIGMWEWDGIVSLGYWSSGLEKEAFQIWTLQNRRI